MKKLIVAVFICFAGYSYAQEELTRILFVLDASNSMNKKWGNESRFVTAKRIVSNSVDSLRGIPNLEIALRVYGHQSPITASYQDCADTKLEVPFAKNNHDAVLNKIRTIRAKGTTPIARSLEQAADDFPDKTSRNVIILITDGIEACDDEPCVIADKLRAKGITISPFVIGLGMDMSYLSHFDCYGNYKSAEDPQAFEAVLKNVVNKALVNTTVQINLNTTSGKPLETDVTLFLYESGTKNLKYSYVHTLNEAKLPDTLVLDPSIPYDLVAKTLPEQVKTGIKILRNTHNTVELPTPQGQIKVVFNQPSRYDYVDVRVMEKGKTNTLNVQKFNATQEYIVGEYELEVLTLPRRYKTIKVSQSALNTVSIDAPGVANFSAYKIVTAQVFEVKENNEFEWVCDLLENTLSNTFILQPGKYKVVYRQKDLKSTSYTKQKDFNVYSNKTVTINL
ncbi:VWA domain-containing protein [Brumimicrobium glaciale]|uniref:VWA domain-containing protein n=1 Tax=Brumimicrobium glaciale TaxID=200475 RepID=A0A4Q4KEZ8_9FLAO|nr:VWA domain-containing protein [Brumimicrobium glaciale]RYM30794.1 VWA domain-containing protein [Brumimicrobium glaciale]